LAKRGVLEVPQRANIVKPPLNRGNITLREKGKPLFDVVKN